MEVALAFFKACGAYLQDVNNQGYQRWALPSCCNSSVYGGELYAEAPESVFEKPVPLEQIFTFCRRALAQ